MKTVTDLTTLMSGMSPLLDSRLFVFVTVEAEALPKFIDDAVMVFREKEGLTLIVEASYAEAHGLGLTFPCRMITLEIHSALDAVGFLAAILPILADAGMGVNPVSAFHHDHLFVPADRADDALRILRELAASAMQTSE